MNEPTTSPIAGLSEDEALRRRSQGQGNDAQVKTGRSYGRIVRDSVFTFFNIVLFALAVVLLVLGSPREWDSWQAATGWRGIGDRRNRQVCLPASRERPYSDFDDDPQYSTCPFSISTI